MFRLKTTRRNVKRGSSPIRPLAELPAVSAVPSGSAVPSVPSGSAIPTDSSSVSDLPLPSGSASTVTSAAHEEKTNNMHKSESLEKQMVNFFEAESAAVSLSKPWLRLERGLRLQKYRAFAEAYPGLNREEKEMLYKVLLRANDAKLLNTKQHIQYENGIIQSVRGLKVIKTGDPSVLASFKIDTLRSTKKNLED